MKLMRLAMCVAAFAVFGKIALAEDVDVRSLQAKLAAQEARLNDLQAKVNYNGEANANYNGCPEAIVSLNKNALVSIGGQVNTRYFYHSGRVNSVYSHDAATAPSSIPTADANYPIGPYQRRGKISEGDLTITDAKLYVDVQVNDNFDAFLQMDLQSSTNTASDNAEKYYIRWKNICNTGFGIKVGRDGLVFGEDFGVGILANYSKSGDGAFKDAYWGDNSFAGTQGGDPSSGGVFANINSRLMGPNSGAWAGLPLHNYWDEGRITQITPYWEFCDGKFSAEFSIFQDHSNWDGGRLSSRGGGYVYIDGNKYKSRNYGTSVSARLRWKPIEGLTLSASAVNFYDSWKNDNRFNAPGAGDPFSKNNTAVDFAINYRPCFLPAFQVWAQVLYGWNVNGYKDVDSYTIDYGASYDFCENWTIFASGSWLASKDKYLQNDDKATAWAVYGGIKYVFPYGVDIEAGWKHEEIKLKENFNGAVARTTTLKGKADTAYVHLGFTF